MMLPLPAEELSPGPDSGFLCLTIASQSGWHRVADVDATAGCMISAAKQPNRVALALVGQVYFFS